MEEANAGALSGLGIEATPIVLSETMLRQSIIDAIRTLRDELSRQGSHDYASQGRGEPHKVFREAVLLAPDSARRSVASLYRPKSGDGDPRIWISGLREFATPGDAIALVVRGATIFVSNLTNSSLAERLASGGSSVDAEFLLDEVADLNTAADSEPQLRLRPFEPLEVGPTTETVRVRTVDPDAMGRGLRAHEETRKAVARWISEHGFDPIESTGTPFFDVGYQRGGLPLVVVEVKSLTPSNAVGQLRLGLGQVLDYRRRIERLGVSVVAAVAVEEEPPESGRWVDVFDSVGATLTWPPTFASLPH